MEKICPRNISCKRKIKLTAILLLIQSALFSQPLIYGRMEDLPAITRKMADIVKIAKRKGKKACLVMIPHLNNVEEVLKTMEVGRIEEELAKAVYSGLELKWDNASYIRGMTFLHALPEIQEWNSKAKIHLTVRLLSTTNLPKGLNVIFRIIDPITKKVLKEKKFDKPITSSMILGYEVTTKFDMSKYPPGRYIGESEYIIPGSKVNCPEFENLRRSFFVLDHFNTIANQIGKKYLDLKKKFSSKKQKPDTLAFLVAVLGELDRTVNPDRGNPPLVDIDQDIIFSRAIWWTKLLLEGHDITEEVFGDIRIGVRSEKGIVVPMRIYIPPGIQQHKKRAILYIPSIIGDENEIFDVFGGYELYSLANKYKIIVASIQSGNVKDGGDILGPARDVLIKLFGIEEKEITISGLGRGASHALYEVLSRPNLWKKLIMISGPPVDPKNPAPLPNKRTIFIVGKMDPDKTYLQVAKNYAKKGECIYIEIPYAEKFLALPLSLEKIIKLASQK